VRSIGLQAVGLPAGVTATPSVVQFGFLPVNELSASSAKTVELTNCGDAPLAITAVRIEGANAGEFSIVSPQDFSAPIAQTASLKFIVVMNPHTIGPKQAQLVVEHAGTRVTADLSGTAFGPGDDAGGPTTYYACSAGGGGAVGAAPIALALLAVRRRRRRA
jgi:uncharacterized protein (TIGR03382 family)